MSKNAKIAKNRQNRRFSPFFQTKVALFSNDVCQRMLTQVFTAHNQINKIKHSGSAQKRQKTQFLCNFNGKSRFFVDPARYYVTQRHNPRSDFYNNGLKSSARLEEKKS